MFFSYINVLGNILREGEGGRKVMKGEVKEVRERREEGRGEGKDRDDIDFLPFNLSHL